MIVRSLMKQKNLLQLHLSGNVFGKPSLEALIALLAVTKKLDKLSCGSSSANADALSTLYLMPDSLPHLGEFEMADTVYHPAILTLVAASGTKLTALDLSSSSAGLGITSLPQPSRQPFLRDLLSSCASRPALNLDLSHPRAAEALFPSLLPVLASGACASGLILKDGSLSDVDACQLIHTLAQQQAQAGRRGSSDFKKRGDLLRSLSLDGALLACDAAVDFSTMGDDHAGSIAVQLASCMPPHSTFVKTEAFAPILKQVGINLPADKSLALGARVATSMALVTLLQNAPAFTSLSVAGKWRPSCAAGSGSLDLWAIASAPSTLHTAHRRDAAIGTAARTLHPAPLHPAPCSSAQPEARRSGLQPCTQYRIPCTLYPVPCTLHPAPCTLHPAALLTLRLGETRPLAGCPRRRPRLGSTWPSSSASASR